MKKLSIIATTIVLTSTVYASNSIEESFKNGKVTGDISIHNHSWDNGNGNNDSGFTAGTVGINYSTDVFKGFTLNTGFKAAHKFSEKENNDYKNDFEANSIMNIANISFANDLLTATIGRQEIDLEWIGDYNEAIVVSTTAIPNTTLTAAYSTRQAAVGNDELKNFADVTKDGAFVLDAKIQTSDELVINPYYYTAKDSVDFYGIKADFDTDKFGLTGHFASSSTDSSTNEKDGAIFAFEARTNFADVELSGGYIVVDKDGLGLINSFGDNIDPTEELGDYVYASDTKTTYFNIGYEIANIGLTALYAISDNNTTNKKDKEFTLGASYSIMENLNADITYTDLSLESDTDKSKLVANFTFEF